MRSPIWNYEWLTHWLTGVAAMASKKIVNIIESYQNTALPALGWTPAPTLGKTVRPPSPTWIIIWCKKPCAAIFMVETNWYRNMIHTCWYFVVGRNQPICQPTRQQTRSVTMTDPDTNINNSGSFFSMISVYSLCQVTCVRKPANNKLSIFI